VTRSGAAVVAGLILAVVPVAGPAWAHDGKLKLEVAGDGATGVTVQVRHADGHRLDELVRLTVSATGAGGRSVGPLQLEPAGEGQGFYSSGPILTPGSWRVTVRAPAPHTTRATVEVEAQAAQAAPAAAVPATRRGSGAAGWRWWWTAGLGAVVVLAIGAVVARRRTRAMVLP
jgi:hypothetical protein